MGGGDAVFIAWSQGDTLAPKSISEPEFSLCLAQLLGSSISAWWVQLKSPLAVSMPVSGFSLFAVLLLSGKEIRSAVDVSII